MWLDSARFKNKVQTAESLNHIQVTIKVFALIVLVIYQEFIGFSRIIYGKIMLTETESDAVQDLLAMEIEIMESQESGATDKHALMKNHILKAQ